jgi:thiol-disulfide isomerase/thioredoxin
MKYTHVGAIAALALLVGCARATTPNQATTPSAAPTPDAAPAFTHTRADEWLNSAPLTVEKLRGKVVLVEFWTFGCSNCLHSAKWVKKVAQEKAGAGLIVIGVHTPELPEERNVANVRSAVARLGIRYPVMIDGDYSYWNAMGNHYWPAFYLIDANGQVRGSASGEMHAGDAEALKVERAIDTLLAARS